LISALDQFGFSALELKTEDFLEPDQVIQLGYPPSRIDILTSLTGVDFAACYEARIGITVADIEISFIDLENLRTNKKATGRHQDLADLENVE
jgi:hypothetical protein